jgi:hypothetical protein
MSEMEDDDEWRGNEQDNTWNNDEMKKDDE